jgi:hypothetical protein
MKMQSVFYTAGTEFLNTIYRNLIRITVLARTSRNLTACLRLELVHLYCRVCF